MIFASPVGAQNIPVKCNSVKTNENNNSVEMMDNNFELSSFNIPEELPEEFNTNAEEKGGSPVLAIVLVLLAVAAGCFAFAYSRKKK